MSDLKQVAQQALTILEAWKHKGIWGDWDGVTDTLRAALAEPVPDSKHATIAEWWADKQRKPLTGEEIDQIAIKCLASPAVDRGWNRNLARAIEQAHGIKDA